MSNAKTITKINRINFKDVISRLDLGSVVYPRYITSEAIIAYVRAKNESGDSNIETLYHLFDHRVEAIEFKVDQESEVTGTPLQALDLKKTFACGVHKPKRQDHYPERSGYYREGRHCNGRHYSYGI